jgi:hypothetical protein
MTTLAAEKTAAHSARLGVFHHHIYEYKKGLRNLILYTGRSEDRRQIEERLAHEGIACLVRDVRPGKINVFFGAGVCIEVIRSFGPKQLADFSGEEDFILGIMLGYDKLKQCERYLQRRAKPERDFFIQNIRRA